MRGAPPSGHSPKPRALFVFFACVLCAGVGLMSDRESDPDSKAIDLARVCTRPHTLSSFCLRHLRLNIFLFAAGTPQDGSSQAQRFCTRFHWLPKQPCALSKALCPPLSRYAHAIHFAVAGTPGDCFVCVSSQVLWCRL